MSDSNETKKQRPKIKLTRDHLHAEPWQDEVIAYQQDRCAIVLVKTKEMVYELFNRYLVSYPNSLFDTDKTFMCEEGWCAYVAFKQASHGRMYVLMEDYEKFLPKDLWREEWLYIRITNQELNNRAVVIEKGQLVLPTKTEVAAITTPEATS